VPDGGATLWDLLVSSLALFSGSLKCNLSKPPPDAPMLPGWSRGRGFPDSAIAQVASIISEVHLGSPMLMKVSLGLTDNEPVGQLATQKK
jgi:hypothetical protein